MGWRIVEIETDEYIQLYLNNLLIKRSNEKIMINLSDIDTLILNNDRASISLKLLNALTSNNVNVILMNSKHEPGSFIVPVEGNHMSLKVVEKQIQWNHEFKSKLWMNIIKNKIFGQAMMIQRTGVNAWKDFKEYIKDVQEYDITNREGHAAKVYWHSLFGLKFTRGDNELESPVINSMLNYGYAILRSAVIRSIYKKGLDPRISIFHKSFSNFFALASDLMEPFRPLVDEVAYQHRNERIFTYEIKDKLIDLLNKKVRVDGKEQYLNNAIDIVVDDLVKEKGWTWVDLWD